jgi:DNA-directed RNA polymerase specialized sigma24 family protein
MLAPLGDRERAAVVLRGLGWSYSDAAERLGVTVRRLGADSRAREKVRQRELEGRADLLQLPPRMRLLEGLRRDPPPFLTDITLRR